MAEKDCVLIFVIIGVFLLFAFFIAWLAAFLDDKDKEVENRRAFLSGFLGYEVLSFRKWCQTNNIDSKKYRNDKIVNSAYRSYLLQIEAEVNQKLKI